MKCNNECNNYTKNKCRKPYLTVMRFKGYNLKQAVLR